MIVSSMQRLSLHINAQQNKVKNVYSLSEIAENSLLNPKPKLKWKKSYVNNSIAIYKINISTKFYIDWGMGGVEILKVFVFCN